VTGSGELQKRPGGKRNSVFVPFLIFVRALRLSWVRDCPCSYDDIFIEMERVVEGYAPSKGARSVNDFRFAYLDRERLSS